jgi:hypothetical protein
MILGTKNKTDSRRMVATIGENGLSFSLESKR